MQENRIEVPTEEGIVDGRGFVPDGEGPWPLVIFYMDAGGLRPSMSAMANRLVDAGYAVVQPNLYWRAGAYAPFDFATVFTDSEERKRLMTLTQSFTPVQAMSDTRLLIAAQTRSDPRVKSERFGCVGYCMGGRMSLIAAAELAPRVAAAASIHGGGLVTDAPNSPHLGAPRIEGDVYLGVADEDPSCPEAHQQALREALDRAGVRYTLERYPGARHGFAVPDAPTYDATAAERHWRRVLNLFGEALRSGAP